MKRSTVISFLILLPFSLMLSDGALGERHGEHGKMMGGQTARRRSRSSQRRMISPRKSGRCGSAWRSWRR